MTDAGQGTTRSGRRPLFLAGLAVAAAATGFAVAGFGRGDGNDGLPGGPDALAVLTRPANAEDRKARADGQGALSSQLNDSEQKRDEVRFLWEEGETVVVLVATEAPPKPSRGEKADGEEVPFGRFKQLCISYSSGGFANVACGDRRKFLEGGIGGISQSAVFSAETKEEDVMEAPEPFLGPDGTPVPSHFYGLVPNAVARVEQTFSGGVPSAKGPVENNFYDVVSTHPEASDRNGEVLWFDDEGKSIPH